MAERVTLPTRKLPQAVPEYRPERKLAEEAEAARLRARLDELFRSGKVVPETGLPAFLDRRLWGENT